MRTFPILEDGTGRLMGFEIENAYLSLSRIAALLEQHEGISNVQVKSSYSTESDIRLKFRFFDRPYLVIEPFGDNSRYLVTPAASPNGGEDFATIRGLFEKYQPPTWRKLIGDVLTLRPLSWIWQKLYRT